MNPTDAIVCEGLTKQYHLPIGSASPLPRLSQLRWWVWPLFMLGALVVALVSYHFTDDRLYPSELKTRTFAGYLGGTFIVELVIYAVSRWVAGVVFNVMFSMRDVKALDYLNLSIKRGEVFGLLGPNGAGKTTTISLLLGLIWPTRGKAWIMGRPAGDLETRRRIGYLPEETYLYRHLNAEETLFFYGKLFGLDRAVLRRRVDELLDLVGLDKTARLRPLKTYSKGMARRIGLAQALINDPDVVILDEPTSGLDPIGSLQMKDIIIRLKQEGKTILMSSHLLADVEDVCDRVAMLYRGKIAIEGRVQDLLAVKDVFQLQARNVSPELSSKLQELVAAEGGKIEDIGYQRTRLENLFRDLVAQRREQENAQRLG